MPDKAATKADAVAFEGITPVLAVRDLTTSIAYYTSVLGFTINWQQPGLFASVSRGPCTIFLSEGDQGHPGMWLWIGVSDVETLFQEYVSKGAAIRHVPTNYEWAYEMQVEDPDGHVLRFGSDARSDQPVGEWLDMRGARWVRSADGQWSRPAGPLGEDGA